MIILKMFYLYYISLLIFTVEKKVWELVKKTNETADEMLLKMADSINFTRPDDDMIYPPNKPI
jgi:hypothetical protein